MENLKKLGEIKEGTKCKIRDINLAKNIKRKLLELGLIPGREIEILQVAPFNGPVRLKVNDFCLALRRNEANKILVEECKKRKEN
jgi:ferrous iron transport protein A